MDIDTGFIQPQAKECQGFPAATRSQKRSRQQIVSQRTQREPQYQKLDFGLQNHEGVNFSCLKKKVLKLQKFKIMVAKTTLIITSGGCQGTKSVFCKTRYTWKNYKDSSIFADFPLQIVLRLTRNLVSGSLFLQKQFNN